MAKKSVKKAPRKPGTAKSAKARKSSAKPKQRTSAGKASPKTSSNRAAAKRSAANKRVAKGLAEPKRVAKDRAPARPAASSPRIRIAPAARGRAPAAAATGAARPLSKAEIDELRDMLLRKRAEILGDVSTLRNEALSRDRSEAAGDLSSMPIHMADLGTDNFEMEFTLGLIEGERAILKEIDEALERIQAGTYGICLATGKPIGKARLKARPWAKYCYEYTLAQETGQARRF